MKDNQLPSAYFSFLVSKDPSVEYYLVRNPVFHLTSREFTAVQEWVQSTKNVHFIRDLDLHINQSIVDDLWGVKRNTRENRFITRALDQLTHSPNPTTFNIHELYPMLRDQMYCHDSVSCGKWRNSVNFSLPLSTDELRIGQRFTASMEPLQMDPVRNSTSCSQEIRYGDLV